MSDPTQKVTTKGYGTDYTETNEPYRGVILASPGPIGGTTPAEGTFTDLTVGDDVDVSGDAVVDGSVSAASILAAAMRMTTGAGLGKVIQGDADGNFSWASAPSGTVPSGTAQDQILRYNGSAWAVDYERQETKRQGLYTIAASQAAPYVADNDNLDFGTGNFTLRWRGMLPDYTPASNVVLLRKYATQGYILYLLTNGTLYLQFSASQDVTSSAAVAVLDNTTIDIMAVITRESASAAGSVVFYVNGVQLGTSRPLAQGTPGTFSNTDPLYIMGNSTTQYQGTTFVVQVANRALSAAEVLDLYRNGMSYSDKWGSQTAIETTDFSAGVDGYIATNGVVAGNIDSIGGVDNWLRFTCDTTNATHYVSAPHLVSTYAKRYRLTYTYYIPSGQSNVTRIRPTLSGAAVAALNYGSTTDTAATVVAEFENTVVTGEIRINAYAGSSVNFQDAGGDDVFYIKDITLVEIGSTLALEPEGLRPDGWYDSSTNKVNATFPASGWTLTRTDPIGVPNAVPSHNLLSNSEWKAMSQSTLENVGSAIASDTMAADGTVAWSKSSATLLFDTDHYTMETSAIDGAALIENKSVTAGKLYKLSVDIQNGTASSKPVALKFNDGASQISSSTSTAAGWTTITFVVEAASTSATAYVGVIVREDITGTINLKNFSFYEVTPGYLTGTTNAPDGWIKSSNLKLYREHTGSNTTGGSYYALKSENAAANLSFRPFGNTAVGTEPTFLAAFKGRQISYGMWVKCSSANHVRLAVTDDGGSTYTYSSYHSGGGAYELLTVTKIISASASQILFSVAADVNGDIAYYSKPKLTYGSTLGDYAPKPSEIISLDAPITLTNYNATVKSNTSDVTINLEAESSGKIGKGIKAIAVQTKGKDSAAADGVGFDVTTSSTNTTGVSNRPAVNNITSVNAGRVGTDANGDVYFNSLASGSSTLTATVTITAIEP